MRKIAIMDLDECLMNFREDKDQIMWEAVRRCEAGEHFSTAWAEWNEECGRDTLNPTIAQVYNQLVEAGFYMVLLSARGVANQAVTEAFMAKYGLHYDEMYLRPEHYEGLPSSEYKEKMVADTIGWDDVVIAVDDSSSNLRMFEAKGVVTIVATR